MTISKTTTAFLSTLLVASQQVNAGIQYINYGDNIYLQNYDVSSAWLDVEPMEGARVYVDNVLAKANQYQYAQVEFVSTGSMANPNSDPEKGSCVKYGDTFGLFSPQVYSDFQPSDPYLNFYLSVEVPTGVLDMPIEFGTGVEMQQFTIRSTQGNGLLSQDNNSDPLFGACVQDDAVAYIQSTYQTGLWLGQSKDGSTSAQVGYLAATATASATDVPIQPSQIQNPHWIVTKSLSNGNPSFGIACSGIPNSTTGSWQVIQGIANGSSQQVSYSVGTTTTDSQSVTSTQGWKTSITASASAGFDFMGAAAKVSVSVTGEYSQSQQSSISTAVSYTTEKGFTANFGEGQVWQFTYATADICETAGFSITTEELVLTQGFTDYPCCLPGYFQDNNNPHGPCVQGSPCACSADVCNGTTNSRGLRGSMK
jgi:hypothetical protein